MVLGELPLVKPGALYPWGHTDLLCSSLTPISSAPRMSPANSGSPSKERTRARRCQKHQHGSVTRLGTKLSQSLRMVGPVSCTSLLFKGKWDCGVCCLLSPGEQFGRDTPLCRDGHAVSFQGATKAKKNQLQDQRRRHTSTASTGRRKRGAGMDWAVQMWGLVCGFRKLISTEFYSFPLAPWALWWSFFTTAQKKGDFQEGNEALDKLSS